MQRTNILALAFVLTIGLLAGFVLNSFAAGTVQVGFCCRVLLHCVECESNIVR